MNDITLEEMIAATSDEALKAWWTSPAATLPPEYSVAEFFMKTLHACSIAATVKNATLEPGQKIVGYLPATNSSVETSKNNQLFFKRTAAVIALVAVDLDNSFPAVG